MFRLRVGDLTADDHSALCQLVLSMACVDRVGRCALWQIWTAFRRLLPARLLIYVPAARPHPEGDFPVAHQFSSCSLL